MKIKSVFLCIIIFLPIIVTAQNSITREDYDRAVGFTWKNVNDKKAFNLFVQPHWFPDSSGVWYIHQSAGNKNYLKITLPELKKSDLFDHQKLATILSDSLGKKIKAAKLPISNIEYKNSKELVITVKGKKYLLNTDDYSPTIYHTEKVNEKEKASPDNKWIAYSKDYNLYIKSNESDKVRRLSSAGVKGYEYATWYGWYDIMEGEGGERPENFWVDWSKDSKWIYTNICDLRNANKMYLLDWSIDSLYRPKLLSYYRGSPGDTTMVYDESVFFNIESGKEIKPDLPKSTHINSVSMTWSKEPGKTYLLRQSRGYQNLYLYTFDLNKNLLETLYSESSKTNIDNFTYQLAEESGLLFFLSEKSGWRQLYSLDLKTKKEKNLTSGEYYVNSIDKIDEENQRILIRISGKEDGRNPYHQSLYSVSFKGEGLKLLTKEDRHHQINISLDGKYFVDNFSTANIETITALRSTETGEILVEMGKADVSAIDGWQPPQIFTAMAHDGKTTIYGALWKPTNFDPNKKYPIIEHSYTGPHAQMFPKDFRRAFSINNQPIAELGFIVIMVDGLGSARRSKEFHNYSYKNLGGTLTDHVGAIRQLGSRFNWIDTTRVGIFGQSAGGYDAAHALLAYPDFYKVAVSRSADHDHRMEKAWWPEMYMGWPVDSAYHKQSNITMAGNLKGRLLLTHGGIDENVNPSATFKLAEALINNDKQFDMLILPSQRHGYRGDHLNYYTKRQWNYFVRHLLGMEPIWDFKL